MTDTNLKTEKKIKNKGPIRWEAIIPFIIFTAVIFFYFKLFFDLHLKNLMELIGYHSLGAEVNIAKVETSFTKASLKISGIELTNPERPSHNNLVIGEIRFSLLWDALLRAKFVVEEAAVENIGFDQKRKYPGKVKPPEPEKESAIKKEADKLKEEALEKAKTEYQDNVLGNIANLMSGGSQQGELDKLKGQIISKEKMKTFEESLKAKQKDWEERIKKLPKAAEFQAIGDNLKKVKTSGFNNLDELNQSVKEIQKNLDEANNKIKEINIAKTSLDADIKFTDEGLKEIKNQIEKDIKDLEAHFKIPKIDAKSIAVALFKRYTGPYLGKINHYKSLVNKYAPPNLLKKNKEEPEIQIQPKPREKGVVYEFGKPNSYPLFWIKKTLVTSRFVMNSMTPDSSLPLSSFHQMGNIKGEIENITSNQSLIGKPTIATLSGDFPAEEILGFKTQLTIDNTKKDSQIDLNLTVDSYPLSQKELINSEEIQLSFDKAKGSLKSQLHLLNYKNLTLKVENEFREIDYAVQAKNKDVESILKNVFSTAKTTNLIASGKGILPSVDLDIESDLGGKIQKGFEKEIQAKIDEARKKIKALVDAEIEKQKEAIEKQVKIFKDQIQSEIQKLQVQAEGQKKLAENKTEEAKKDFERKAEAEKKKAENEAKKKVESELKKSAEDLKKKLGF
ncbi:MAG: TIGR03545 family protein [Bdellovibrionaceae bacterium]|nr:TIGR03545 family protein [Pseudobdellovibrionaceae bacterium]